MKFPRKVTISRDGVFVNETEIPGVVSADVMHINPGRFGTMQVTLVVNATEVDVQYNQYPKLKNEKSN